MAALNAVARAQADWLVASAEAAARFDLPWEEVQAQRPCRDCGLGDVVHAVTAKLGLPHCPGCARRKRWLNRVTPGWVRWGLGVTESLWTSRPRWSLLLRMVWLLVRIYMMNRNASPLRSGDVRAALPTRAPRETNERQRHRHFNPGDPAPVWPVRHKV